MTDAISPRIYLDAFPDLGLIVKAPTGVRYSTQAAGLGCEHPEVEGYFVPLRTRVGRPELATLFGLFRGGWQSLSAGQADTLDRAISRHGFSSMRVDRSMLAHSREAWVHVIVAPDDQESIPLAGLPHEVRGILIWPNSD